MILQSYNFIKLLHVAINNMYNELKLVVCVFLNFCRNCIYLHELHNEFLTCYQHIAYSMQFLLPKLN